MNGKALLIGAAILAVIILTSATGNTGPVDLSSLVNTYGADKVQRLQNLQNALAAAGLNNLQIRLLMAQCLFETGLFTSVWNQNATDNLNNWAGISPGGSLGSYPDINTFVAAYIALLQRGADPLDATDINDFNNRLVANGYYTENPSVYLAGITQYFNMLS